MKTIPTKPVKSSQIKAIGYDAESKTLAVTFVQGGSTYHYSNVTHEDYTALMDASSVGSRFINFIKKFPAKFPFQKVEDSTAAAAVVAQNTVTAIAAAAAK